MKLPTFALNGLQTDPGPFSGAADGALVEAQNVVCERRGLLEPRGPFALTSDPALLAGAPVTQHGHQVEGQPMRTWSWISPSTWIMRSAQATTITGPTTFTRGRLHSEYVRGRMLFTSEDGVCEWPQSGTIAYRAGLPQPSCASVVCTNMAPFTNWLGNNQSVAYRLTFTRVRADGTIMESAPSAPIIVRNTSGGSLGVIVSYTPYDVGSTFDTILPTDMMNIYRGPVLASATGTPSDVMRLRASVPLSAPGLVDRLADSEWNGPELYTNARRDGILKARTRPAYARDVTTYNRMTMFAGYETPMRVAVTCKAIGDIAADPSQTICSKQIVGSVSIGSPNITGISTTDGAYIAVGQYVTDGANSRPNALNAKFPANTTILSYNPGTGVAVASANALVTAAAGAIVVWDWIAVTDGATTYRQWAKPANSTLGSAGANDILWNQAQDAGGTQYFGYAALETQWNVASTRVKDVLLRAVGSDEVGGRPEVRNVLMVFERASQNSTAFTIKSTKPNAFDRVVDSVTGVTSAMDGGDARLAVSTPDIPDAVPDGQYVDIGDLASPIYRILPMRSSVLVVKGDGLYLVYGTDPAALSVTQLDATVAPPRYDIAANWVTKLGDTVYMMSSRGPMAITDAGATPFGADIYETLRELLGPGFERVNLADAVSAGSAQATPTVIFSFYRTAPAASAVFVYNVDTQAWTTWSARRGITALWTGTNGAQVAAFTAGRTGTYRDDRTSMGAPISATSTPLTGDTGETLPSSTPTIISVNRYTLSKGIAQDVQVGDVVIRDGRFGVVEAVPTTTTITVVTDGALVIAAGTAALVESYPVRVVWTARTLGEIAKEKRYASISYAFALRALLLRFSGYFQTAYAPAGVQSLAQPQYRAGWTNGGADDLQTLLAAPEMLADGVPLDVVRDWGARVGFTLQQAYSWFSLGAVTLDVLDGGERTGRGRP